MPDKPFKGGDEIETLLRSHDWSQTPLGAIETWTDSLKAAAQILLTELNQAQNPEPMLAASVLPSQNCTQTATLRQAAQSNAFRVTLAEALRPLTDADEIQATAARILGEHLGASRVIYAEVLPGGKDVIVHKNYINGVAELSGQYCLDEFGRNLTDDHRAGRTAIVPNVANSLRYTNREKAMYRAIDIAAHLDVPLIKKDQFVALLAVHQATPRQWTEGEVKWVEETAEQTWATVERARAEAALRKSEAKYRTVFESIDEGFCTIEVLFDADGKPVDHQILQANPAFKRQSGIANLEGKRASELVPGQEQYWNDLYAQVIHTGESIRTEERADALDRWFDVLVSRIGDAAMRQVAIVSTDISARKRAENTVQQTSAELERQVRKWDAIAATVPDFIYTFDLSGRFTYISQALLDLWQKASAEALGKNFFELDYPEDLAARLQHQIQQVIETRQPLKDEMPYTSAIETRAYEYIFAPMFDATGAVEAVAGVTRDITDRKQAEAALRQTSADLERQVRKFDATLSTLTELIFSFDQDGRFLYVNQELLDLWGITAAEAIGKTMAELDYPPAVEQQVLNDMRRVFKTGDTVKNEAAYTNPAGVEGYFEYILSPVFAADDTVESVVGSSRDTSERKRMEIALRENEERFRTLADNMSQFAWMADEAGWIFWYNQRWFDYTGTTLEEMQGWGWQQVHHPDHVDCVVEHFRYCLETGEQWEDTFPLRSRDGTYRWFLSRAIPIRDEQGQILRWFGTNTDITDLKQAEANLQESEELKRRILESSQDCIKVLTLEGRLLYLNVGGLDLLEIDDPASVLNSQWLDFWKNEDRQSAEAALASAQAGNAGQLQGCCPTAKGNLRWWDVIVTPIRDASGRVAQLLSISRDITKQKQAESEQEHLLKREQAAREEAERANRIKDEFLAVLSHELRSPLNPILGWTQLLRNGKLASSRQMDALATIERNAKLQSQLIEDLLDVSRIMQGKLTLTAAPVSLAFVIAAAVETVRLAADAKNIQITLDLDPNVAPVSGDAARLQQIVWNLLSNAVKFTDNGGQVTVQLRQVAAAGRGNAVAQIRVIDTGKGISPQFLPHVFEYFRQEDGSTTRKFGGLGLGLAIVRQIAELHGGKVNAESSGEHQGATFIVQLPALPQAPPILFEQNQLQSASETRLDNVQILLVEDDADAREFQAFLLEQHGATVAAVASGVEALQTLEQLIPDVIVSDIGMADMDGYRLMQQIRSRPPAQGGTVPAIALTAYAAEIDQKRALEVGFQTHLTKPLEPERFVSEIVTLLKPKRV
ncbi:PAS domain S-box protein [Nodosilinea sp. E11]|uniref:PAS domain S-box protein n=1 Tax=Nodosilinea sp. E11 TaxID=3037479 RepID=UPI0029346053|nr:PAS domain S-box protein [Nodosilinea sp. E11]